jgi:hypothetical protein
MFVKSPKGRGKKLGDIRSLSSQQALTVALEVCDAFSVLIYNNIFLNKISSDDIYIDVGSNGDYSTVLYLGSKDMCTLNDKIVEEYVGLDWPSNDEVEIDDFVNTMMSWYLVHGDINYDDRKKDFEPKSDFEEMLVHKYYQSSNRDVRWGEIRASLGSAIQIFQKFVEMYGCETAYSFEKYISAVDEYQDGEWTMKQFTKIKMDQLIVKNIYFLGTLLFDVFSKVEDEQNPYHVECLERIKSVIDKMVGDVEHRPFLIREIYIALLENDTEHTLMTFSDQVEINRTGENNDNDEEGYASGDAWSDSDILNVE